MGKQPANNGAHGRGRQAGNKFQEKGRIARLKQADTEQKLLGNDAGEVGDGKGKAHSQLKRLLKDSAKKLLETAPPPSPLVRNQRTDSHGN